MADTISLANPQVILFLVQIGLMWLFYGTYCERAAKDENKIKIKKWMINLSLFTGVLLNIVYLFRYFTEGVRLWMFLIASFLLSPFVIVPYFVTAIFYWGAHFNTNRFRYEFLRKILEWLPRDNSDAVARKVYLVVLAAFFVYAMLCLGMMSSRYNDVGEGQFFDQQTGDLGGVERGVFISVFSLNVVVGVVCCILLTDTSFNAPTPAMRESMRLFALEHTAMFFFSFVFLVVHFVIFFNPDIFMTVTSGGLPNPNIFMMLYAMGPLFWSIAPGELYQWTVWCIRGNPRPTFSALDGHSTETESIGMQNLGSVSLDTDDEDEDRVRDEEDHRQSSQKKRGDRALDPLFQPRVSSNKRGRTSSALGATKLFRKMRLVFHQQQQQLGSVSRIDAKLAGHKRFLETYLSYSFSVLEEQPDVVLRNVLSSNLQENIEKFPENLILSLKKHTEALEVMMAEDDLGSFHEWIDGVVASEPFYAPLKAQMDLDTTPEQDPRKKQRQDALTVYRRMQAVSCRLCSVYHHAVKIRVTLEAAGFKLEQEKK